MECNRTPHDLFVFLITVHNIFFKNHAVICQLYDWENRKISTLSNQDNLILNSNYLNR